MGKYFMIFAVLIVMFSACSSGAKTPIDDYTGADDTVVPDNQNDIDQFFSDIDGEQPDEIGEGEAPDDFGDFEQTEEDNVDIQPEPDMVNEDMVDEDTVDVDILPDTDPLPVSCTGQTKCYDNTEEITCPAEENDFYGQDAQYAALGMCVPKSYTIGDTPPEEIVTDNNTGLIWQRTLNATTHTWANAITYCENLSYGSYNDWRLPTRRELATLPDYGRFDPAIDTAIFPATPSAWFWSSSSYAYVTDYAWFVHSYYGTMRYSDKTSTSYVRCVRGAPLPDSAFTEETISGEVIVTDKTTGLIWTKDYYGGGWEFALYYCENLDYGGATDWRLPNVEELKSLIDDTIHSPASKFPGIPSGSFWSSSSSAFSTDYAWYVDLASGDVLTNFKAGDYYACCVRQ
ncbi:MAG TPA: DUF1566 domain-containing protein [bacterium]|nr:DUF1566 domain-containing protein [bacterium]